MGTDVAGNAFIESVAIYNAFVVLVIYNPVLILIRRNMMDYQT